MTGRDLTAQAGMQLRAAQAALEQARGLSAVLQAPWWAAVVPVYVLAQASGSARLSIQLEAPRRALVATLGAVVDDLQGQVTAGDQAGDTEVDPSVFAAASARLAECVADLGQLEALGQRAQGKLDGDAAAVAGAPADAVGEARELGRRTVARLSWLAKFGPLVLGAVAVVVIVVLWRAGKVAAAARAVKQAATGGAA